MISFNQNYVAATSSAIDMVMALLAVVADAERAKNFLAELKAALAEGGRAAGQAEIERHRAELLAQERVLLDRKNQLDSREIDLGDAARRLTEREAALAAKMDRLKKLAA